MTKIPRDLDTSDQLNLLAMMIEQNREIGPTIKRAARDIAILCAEQYTLAKGGKRHQTFVDQLKQYMVEPTWRLKEKISWRRRYRGAGLSDAADVILSGDDYGATKDAAVTVHITNKHGLDLTQVKARMNSLLDELGL